MTNVTIDNSGTMTIQGGGISKYGDDVATLDFSGAGVVTETGMASIELTPTDELTLTAGAASTWSTAAGALTLTSAEAATWSTTAGALTLTSADAATWSTTANALTLEGAGGVNIGFSAGICLPVS